MRSTQRKTLMSALALVILAGAYGAASIGAPAAGTPAMLVGTQEVPPVQTKALASSGIVVAEDMSVAGSVITSDIEPTMAQIHPGAVGVSGPVLPDPGEDHGHAVVCAGQYQADGKAIPELQGKRSLCKRAQRRAQDR